MNRRVDAVYVLSVRSFAQRIAHIEAEMARHGIAFEFVFDHDADAIPAELIERRFAPSDLTRAQQSLVLKQIHVWRLCVERQHDRVLMFEDDVVLADDFDAVFRRAMDEADALAGPYLIYLGRGNNQYLGLPDAGPMLVAAGLLPAADATVFNREAAKRRLDFIEQCRITRPADWLTREIDAAVGVPHYWLRRPIVIQGSMNGRFESTLDAKRIARGRWYSWLRFRWDAWWKHLRQNLGLRRHR